MLVRIGTRILNIKEIVYIDTNENEIPYKGSTKILYRISIAFKNDDNEMLIIFTTKEDRDSYFEELDRQIKFHQDPYRGTCL